jgi:hypothetical protein
VKRLSLQNAKQISNLVKPHDARVVKGVILMLHGFYPATAIYVLEIAFWAPFLFLPVAASGMVDDQACANTLFDTAAFRCYRSVFPPILSCHPFVFVHRPRFRRVHR